MTLKERERDAVDLLSNAIVGNCRVLGVVARDCTRAETTAGEDSPEQAPVGTTVTVGISLDPGGAGSHDCSYESDQDIDPVI